MTTDPFAILGIAPTLELSAVKRAWFSALPGHPPETDPEGFRRLRNAYEQLSTPGQLAVAFAAAPVDFPTVERAWAERFDGCIDACAREVGQKQSPAVAVQQFIDRFAGQTWDEALRTITAP
jgi:hypothetical protein